MARRRRTITSCKHCIRHEYQIQRLEILAKILLGIIAGLVSIVIALTAH